ncbi:MAG: hypothetical protein CM1200mP40_36230 [Gammaproteobacteria bacterium]|nr:MAG: hypothetical protein CM1200mP40_36230 [Gammaproteobacteria bacterium]
MVVDLRNNGGGSLSEANQLVGLFIETGATVQIRTRAFVMGLLAPFGDNDPEVAYDGPLAVLVNRTSASASEIFAGAIQDYQRGIVLGGQTFGKGTVQEIIPMDYGQVKLTRSKFYRILVLVHSIAVLSLILSFQIFTMPMMTLVKAVSMALFPGTQLDREYRTYHAVQNLLPELRSLHEERASLHQTLFILKDK